jgi:hypothetical protein
MSHNSESVPPSLGAMFLNLFVSELKTAKLDTLPKTVPSRFLTWVNLPPSQTLVPTCSIALTRPSTIGVSSGISDGNARALPDSASMMAVNANTTMAATSVLLMPSSHSITTMSPPSSDRRTSTTCST